MSRKRRKTSWGLQPRIEKRETGRAESRRRPEGMVRDRSMMLSGCTAIAAKPESGRAGERTGEWRAGAKNGSRAESEAEMDTESGRRCFERIPEDRCRRVTGEAWICRMWIKNQRESGRGRGGEGEGVRRKWGREEGGGRGGGKKWPIQQVERGLGQIVKKNGKR